jgi:hypothetical protein
MFVRELCEQNIFAYFDALAVYCKAYGKNCHAVPLKFTNAYRTDIWALKEKQCVENFSA